MGVVVRAKIQTVEDMYRLIRSAVTARRPISAIYEQLPRLVCPHRLGRNSAGKARVLCYQYGGESRSGLERGFAGKLALHGLEKLSQVKLLEETGRQRRTIPASSCVVDADIDAEDHAGPRSTKRTVRELASSSRAIIVLSVAIECGL